MQMTYSYLLVRIKYQWTYGNARRNALDTFSASGSNKNSAAIPYSSRSSTHPNDIL